MGILGWFLKATDNRVDALRQDRPLRQESLEDRNMLSGYTVDTNFGGALQTGDFSGSLRWVLAQTNLQPDLDEIRFNLDSTEYDQGITLAGTGLQITNPVQIFGTNQGPGDTVTIKAGIISEPAFVINSFNGGSFTNGFIFDDLIISGAFADGIRVTRLPSNGQLLVDGVAFIGTAGDGLDLMPAVNNVIVTVRNSGFANNSGHGIHAHNAGSNSTTLVIDNNDIVGNGSGGIRYTDFDAPIQITNNSIGVFDTGSGEIVSSNKVGIWISSSASTVASTISGNTISGNRDNGIGAGIRIQGSAYNNLKIDGNYIGTNSIGQLLTGYGNDRGIDIQTGSTIQRIQQNSIASSLAQGIQVFDSDAGLINQNLIVANLGNGILLDSGSDQWTITNNSIGDSSLAALGNGNDGLHISNSGDSVISGNLFGRNTGSGITVVGAGADKNRFGAGNSFYNNAQIPIDLNNDGPTSNDTDDQDPGPNNFLNYGSVVGRSIIQSGGNWPIRVEFDVDQTGQYELLTYRYTNAGIYTQIDSRLVQISQLMTQGIDASLTYSISGGILSTGDRVATVLRATTTTTANDGNSSEMSPLSSPLGLLVGDYNRNGIVDTSDYTVWRDALGSSATPFSGADGNGDGFINAGDYSVWRWNFGATFANPAALVLAVAPGDYNADGVVDLVDLDLWESTFGSTSNLAADGNGNGVIDLGDLAVWQEYQGVTTLDDIAGDFNTDGIVDNDDLALWQTGDLAADANNDSLVDQADYDIWLANFGTVLASEWPLVINGSAGTLENPLAAPQIVEVSVSNSSNGHSFSSDLGSGDQLSTVPVSNVSNVSISFSEEVFVTLASLSIVNLDGTAPSTVTNFAYDVATQTAIWTFNTTFTDGRYLLRLADSIYDLDHETLDGEFTNPWSLADTGTSIFPSGDGIEGGEFRFRFTILSGDTDGDNIDGSTNYTTWHSHEPGLALVTTTTDEFDYGYAYGDLSLREAIYLANTASEYTTVIVPEGYYQLSLSGAETISQFYVSLNDLDILADQRVVGAGAGRTIVDAAGLAGDGHGVNDRIFDVGSYKSFDVSGVTLTGGHVRATSGTNALGGAIYTRIGSTLNLRDSALVNNHVDRESGSTMVAAGGALALYGHATIDRSVFAGNSAYSTGGAAYVIDDAGAPPDYIVTVANSVFAHNVATSSNGTQNVRTGSTVTSLGNNLADADTAGVEAVFDVTGASADYVGTAPTYIVTSIVDTFDHTDDAYAVSLREAIDLSNGSSASNKEIWLPGWDFLLTQGGNLNVAESTYGPNLVDRLFQGDLDIAGSLTLRGVRGSTSVGWAPPVQATWSAGVTDKVFELIGDYNGDGLVDAADYTVWADSQGETGPNLAADGDEDGDVDSTDNSIRVAAFGNVLALIDVAVD